MRLRPPPKPKNQGYLQGQELSDACQVAYAEDHRRRMQYVGAASPGIWTSSGRLLKAMTCPKSGLKSQSIRVVDSSRPSGFLIEDISVGANPKYSGTAKAERRLLEEYGMGMSNEMVAGMFGKFYKSQRADGLPHFPIGHQNFNDRVTCESYVASAVCEIARRENIAWVTELLGVAIHQGPGTLQHKPVELQQSWHRRLRKTFPDCYIQVFATFENILRELEWSDTSKACRYIQDAANAKRRDRAGLDFDTWMDESIQVFIQKNFPPAQWASIQASSWSGSAGEEPILFEVPHVHYLIMVFDKDGEPITYDVIRQALMKDAKARHEILIQQLYPSVPVKGQQSTPQQDSRNTMVQAMRCIQYAIKRSGRCVSDRDLLFRATFRGASPNHGFSDCLIVGERLARNNRKYRAIPAGSPLDKIIKERKRLLDITGLNCPNDGQPELIKQQERRIRRTACPMKVIDGRVVLSGDLTVYKSCKNNNQPIVSNKKTMGEAIGNLFSYPSNYFKGLVKWMKNKLWPGP
jgi:hypothetical protein